MPLASYALGRGLRLRPAHGLGCAGRRGASPHLLPSLPVPGVPYQLPPLEPGPPHVCVSVRRLCTPISNLHTRRTFPYSTTCGNLRLDTRGSSTGSCPSTQMPTVPSTFFFWNHSAFLFPDDELHEFLLTYCRQSRPRDKNQIADKIYMIHHRGYRCMGGRTGSRHITLVQLNGRAHGLYCIVSCCPLGNRHGTPRDIDNWCRCTPFAWASLEVWD